MSGHGTGSYPNRRGCGGAEGWGELGVEEGGDCGVLDHAEPGHGGTSALTDFSILKIHTAVF